MELIFNPPRQVTRPLPEGMLAAGDRRDASVYVYDDHIRMAVNVALAAERPLLVTGPPGSGKSSLALNVALTLGRHYSEEVITPRTQARDLLWRFDALRRLRDAQANVLKPDDEYIDEGVIWEAFQPPRG